MSNTHNPESPWLFSRLFNPWRCSSNENSRLLVTEVIEKFIQVEVSKESRRRKRKPEDHKRFLKAIEAITCDLIHNHLSDQSSGIAISRSNRVLSRTSRYKNEVLNKTIPYLLDVLELPELQMLEQVVGCKNYFYPEKNGNLRTVVKAGKHLVHLIQKYHVELEDLGLSDGEETIILNREKNDLWEIMEEYLSMKIMTLQLSIEMK